MYTTRQIKEEVGVKDKETEKRKREEERNRERKLERHDRKWQVNATGNKNVKMKQGQWREKWREMEIIDTREENKKRRKSLGGNKRIYQEQKLGSEREREILDNTLYFLRKLVPTFQVVPSNGHNKYQ